MVYILLAPGFEEAEALVPADMLRRANIETALVSLDEAPVPGSHGITVTADVTLDKLDRSQADMVVLPGGPGHKKRGENSGVEHLVREIAAQGRWVAAICAAPTLLGGWGLLEGKDAVCYPGMEQGLTGARAKMDRSVVVDGKTITGRAAGSAFDFGLTLVEVLAGHVPDKPLHSGVLAQILVARTAGQDHHVRFGAVQLVQRGVRRHRNAVAAFDRLSVQGDESGFNVGPAQHVGGD